MHRFAAWGLVVSMGCVIGLGCSSSRPTATPSAKARVVAADGDACQQICEASAACGDSPDTCAPKCNEWLIQRSRPGIAGAAARCAVPRIDSVCGEHDSAKGAATALVSCIDEAGRQALTHDNHSLLVAARAICDRGVRCSDGGGGHGDADAQSCVERITVGNIPRGLGIFGAVKPELVERFALCMDASECGGGQAGASSCFGEMLGEQHGKGHKSAPPTDDVGPTPGSHI
jgi:hypothetical protein